MKMFRRPLKLSCLLCICMCEHITLLWSSRTSLAVLNIHKSFQIYHSKMLSPDNQDWLMSGHDIIFDNIMMMIGLSSLESLHRCRQVCRTWNDMIMRNIWENPRKRNVIMLHGLFRSPSELPEIKCAASLARNDLLGPVERLILSDVDLTSVPAEHLASLVSCVTESVAIEDVSGCGLLTILDCVKSDLLIIRKQIFYSEETRALVRAMESRVRQVVYSDDRTLDIRAAMEYSGQGMCTMIRCFCGSEMLRYREQLKTWAESRNWRVTYDGDNGGMAEISMTNYCLSEN